MKEINEYLFPIPDTPEEATYDESLLEFDTVFIFF